MKTPPISAISFSRSIRWSGLILLSGFMTHATISQAESLSNTLNTPKTAATVTPGSWSPKMNEKGSEFACTGDTFLVGREHSGDENGKTSYLCATGYQFGRPLTVSNRVLSGATKEAYSDYACPDNTVMTGRLHYSDENGDTYYECATLIGELGPLQVAPGPMSGSQPENNSKFECPQNTVLIRRKHDSDENGPTWHVCGALY